MRYGINGNGIYGEKVGLYGWLVVLNATSLEKNKGLQLKIHFTTLYKSIAFFVQFVFQFFPNFFFKFFFSNISKLISYSFTLYIMILIMQMKKDFKFNLFTPRSLKRHWEHETFTSKSLKRNSEHRT